jgi:hypothetical protein
MKIKKYEEFSGGLSLKSDILSYIESSKSEIISKGLDFDRIKSDISKGLDRMSENDIEEILEAVRNAKSEEDVQSAFEMSLEKYLSTSTNEGLIDYLKKIGSKIKNAIEWVSDRIWTISGFSGIGIGAALALASNVGSLDIPTEYANIGIGAAISLGIALVKFGQKWDKYKNYSDI